MTLPKAVFNLLVSVIGLAMVGCGGGPTTTNVDLQKPSTVDVDDDSSNADSEQVTDDSNADDDNVRTKSADLKLTWEDIDNGNKPENRETFISGLEGKTIEITGVVYGMEKRNYTPKTRISLGDPNDQLNSTFVHVAKGEDWAKVNVGDDVTYHMEWDELEGFSNGRVVSGGSPPNEATASALAQRFEADTEKTKSELADKFVIVTGKVLAPHSDFEKGEFEFGRGDIALTLVGQKDTPIVVTADLWIVNDPFKQAKVNDELRIFGKVVFRESDDSGKRPFQIGLEDSVLITK